MEVKDEQITVFRPIDNVLELEDGCIAILRKCVAMLKARNIPESMAEVGVYTGEFLKLFIDIFWKRSYIFLTSLKDLIQKEIK